MAHEAKEWNVGTFRCANTKSGGLHVYVNQTTVDYAMRQSGLYNQYKNPKKKVMVKAQALTGTNNRAKVVLVFKVENVNKSGRKKKVKS